MIGEMTRPAIERPSAAAVVSRLRPPAPRPPAADLPGPQLLRALRRNSLEAWPARAYEELIVHRRFLGADCFLVSDPAVARHVLGEHAARYERPVSARRLIRGVGGGLMIAEGGEWRDQRRMAAPIFAPQRIEQLIPHFVAASDAMLERLEDGARVNLADAFDHLAIDTVGRSILSLAIDSPAQRRISASLRSYFRQGARATIWDFLARKESDYWWFGLQRADFSRRWLATIADIIAVRRRQPRGAGQGAPDLLDLLFEARDPDTGEPLSHDDVLSQTASMLAAAFDTTARALFWCAYLLSRDLDEQARVRAEIAAAPMDRPTSLAGLQRWPRLRNALLEAMRLYPPVSVVVRTPKARDVIGDLEIPTGSLVMISPWVVHRHKALWDEPDLFMPERFETRGAPPFGDGAFMAFGAGRRSCPGAAFALAQTTISLARVLSRYEIVLDDPQPVMPVAIVTTVPSVDPWFRLRRIGRG
jgi:cytochrome P450